MNRTLTSITTAGHSEPGSNGNEGLQHTSQRLRPGTTPSDVV